MLPLKSEIFIAVSTLSSSFSCFSFCPFALLFIKRLFQFKRHPMRLVLLSLNCATSIRELSTNTNFVGDGTRVIMYSYSNVDTLYTFIVKSFSSSLVANARYVPDSSNTHARQYMLTLNTSLISCPSIPYKYP